MELYNKVKWDVYAEVCVHDSVIISTDNEGDATVSILQIERDIMDMGDDSIPLRLCYTITVPPGLEFVLDDLHLLLTLDGRVNNEKIAHWASYLGPGHYSTRAFDCIQSTPIMSMDTEGLHFATAVYTETFPRKWKSIEVFISPIAIYRVLYGE